VNFLQDRYRGVLINNGEPPTPNGRLTKKALPLLGKDPISVQGFKFGKIPSFRALTKGIKFFLPKGIKWKSQKPELRREVFLKGREPSHLNPRP